jgi:hypothetical protein
MGRACSMYMRGKKRHIYEDQPVRLTKETTRKA